MISLREGLLHLMVLSVFAESVGVGPVSIGRVLAVVGLYAAVLVVAAQPRTRVLPFPAIGLVVAFLGIWVFLSVLWSASLPAWAAALAQLLIAFGYFVTYVVLLESREQMRRLLVTYVCGAGVSAVIGLAQTSATVRAVGLQGDPNTYALYEIAAIPIAAVLAASRTGRRRADWFAMMALLVSAIVASQSRGALLALAVVAVYLLWRGDLGGVFARRPHLTTIGGAGFLAVLVGFVVTFVPRYNLTQVKEGRGTGRLDIWHVAWRGWEEHPILGLGAGGFIERSGDLLSSTPGVQLDPYSILFDGIKVHNSYLEPWVELGPVGLVLWVALLVTTASVLLGMRRSPQAGVLRACLPMLMAFATATIFLSAINNKLLWMLVGFAAAYPYLPERKRASARSSPVEVS